MSRVPQLRRGCAQSRGASGLPATRAGETKNRVSPENLGARSGFYVRFGKRIFDSAGAAAVLVIAAPFLLLCALAVRLESRGPIFFRQWRVGQNGKPFQVIKFQSLFVRSTNHAPKFDDLERFARTANLSRSSNFGAWFVERTNRD